MEDPSAALESVKTEVVTQIRAHVLQFLNETLPAIKIPDVGNVAAKLPAKAEGDGDAPDAKAGGESGADEGGAPIRFSVSDLKIEPGAELTIREQDIEVVFGDIACIKYIVRMYIQL